MTTPNLEKPAYSTVRPLVASGSPAIEYFMRRDLPGEDAGPAGDLWDLPAVLTLLKKQQMDGLFPFSGTKKPVKPEHHYSLVETFRRFRLLVKRYGLTVEHEARERPPTTSFPARRRTAISGGSSGTSTPRTIPGQSWSCS